MPTMEIEGWRERLIAKIIETKESGVSLTEIGRRSGVGRNYVSQFVNGDYDPSLTNVVKLCDGLGISLSYVLSGQETTRQDEQMFRLFVALRQKQPGLIRELLIAQGLLSPELGKNSNHHARDNE